MSEPTNTGGVEALLTRDEAAHILKKPVSWLRYAERKGILPYLKVGQHIRYRASDLREWIDGQVERAVRARVDAIRASRGQ